MPSSTTLYTSPGNAGNVASRNFTTLYSGSGSINPTQPYGNANVVGLLAASTDGANTIGIISATGNIISDAFFIGNGSQLTGIVASSVNANALTGNTLSPNVLFSSLTSVGTLSNLSVSGTVTAGTFAGNGSLLTNIPGANVTGTVANATFATTAGSATTAVTVTGNAQANITSVGVLTSLSSTGNITAPYFLGNVIGNITGNIVVGGANTEVLVNNNGNIGPSPGLTFNNASNVLSTSGSVTAVGNIQGNYFLGNGSQLTGLPVQYGNANVATFLANFGSNSISTSGNVTTGNITVTTDAVVQGNLTVNGNTTFINSNVVTINDKFINVANNAATAAQANGGGIGVGPVGAEYATLEYLSTPNVWATNIGLSVTGNVSAGYFAGNGSLLSNITGANVTGTVANATFATSAGTASTVTGNAQANITSVGTLTSLSVSGNTTTGNLLTGGAVSATGNVTGGNVLTGGIISATGNITSGNVIVNGANAQVVMAGSTSNKVNFGTTGAGSPQVGTYSPGAKVVLYDNISNTSTGYAIGIDPNTMWFGTDIAGSNFEYYVGNAKVATIETDGRVTANAVTYTGTDGTNGQALTTYGNGITYFSNVITGPGGANTQIQYNNGGAFAGNTAMTFNNTTGRVQLGNITTLGSIINTANTWVDTTAASISPSTIIIGNGYSGNYTTTYLTNNQRNTRLSLLDLLTATDNGARKTELAATVYYDLNGVTTYGNANVNSRLQGTTSEVYIQNGNIVQSNPVIARSASFVLQAGQSANVGNANLATAGSIQSFVAASNGSRIGNAYGIYSSSVGNTAQGALMPTAMLFVAAPNHQPGSGAVDVGNIFNYYTPGSVNNFGIASGNTTRVANYWNIYNEDNANKNRLGALTQYQESSYSLSSSAGSVVVNKANSQVQYYTVSEAATMSFSGFITVANIPTGGGVPTAVNRYQTDTVTVIVQQDSTGRTITMPSGAAYKYAGGTNTVPATANAISMISITAYYDPGTSATAYLTTISPAFT